MIERLLKRTEPLDFENMIGGCSPSALDQAKCWYNSNVANAGDVDVKALAQYFIDFHKGFLSDDRTHGLIEPNATDANELALKIAKEKTGRTKILCTNLTHSSIEKACQGRKGFFAGIGLEPIVVDTDPAAYFQVNEEELRKKVSEHGKDIAAVVSTHGTTQLGHIEHLARHELVEQLREDGACLHIDAAYGGYISQLSAMMHIPPREYVSMPFPRFESDRFAPKITKLPDADSITLDPYKFIGIQGCALLMVKEGKAPILSVPYYSQSHFTLESTLSAMPIAAWYHTMNDCSIEGLKMMADDCVYTAREIAKELLIRQVPLIRFPQMGIVPIALDSEEEVRSIRESLRKKGFRVGIASIKGKYYKIDGIRIAITPKRGTEDQFGYAHALARKITGLVIVNN